MGLLRTILAVATAAATITAATAALAGPSDPVSSDGSRAARGSVMWTTARPFTGSGVTPFLKPADRTVPDYGDVLDPMPSKGRSIIGSDGRSQITATTSYPYRAIVQIVRTDSTGTWGCTGWMISKDTVATAGHCVHKGSGGSGGFYASSSITVYPGRNVGATTPNPYGSCKPRRLYTVTGWSNSGSSDHDYGAIKLNCTVGNQTGWFGYFWQSASLNNRAARITGYPCDKTFGTMWHMAGSIASSSTRRVTYTIDTFGCQSGSPVYEVRTGNNPYAMAVHTNGGSSSNSGTRIVKAVFDNFNAWKNAP